MHVPAGRAPLRSRLRLRNRNRAPLRGRAPLRKGTLRGGTGAPIHCQRHTKRSQETRDHRQSSDRLDEVARYTEDFPYFMREIGRREGLRQEVLSARNTVMHDSILGETGHIQHPQFVTHRTQTRDELTAAHARHDDIRDEQIRFEPAIAATLQCFFAAARRHDRVTALHEDLTRDIAQARLVFDEQHRRSTTGE